MTLEQIFVEANQGGEDRTRIDAVDFFGFPVVCVLHLFAQMFGLTLLI